MSARKPMEARSVLVSGHAFRKVKGPMSTYRGFVPTCECGFKSFTYTTTLKHARYLHGEHKRSVLRGTA
jgi:hypothetical protein